MASAWARWVRGLNPPSLWFDDAWVGALVKLGGFDAAVSLPAPQPVGFLVLLALAQRLVADPELCLQLVPFLAALASGPAIAWLVHRETGSPGLALAGSAITLLNPLLAAAAVRAKPFALDCLVAALLLLVGLPALRTVSGPRFAGLCGTALVAALLSFPSVLVSIPLVHLAAALPWRNLQGSPTERWGRLAGMVAFDAALAAYALLELAPRRNPVALRYWADQLGGLTGAADTVVAAISHYGAALTSALPVGAVAPAVVAACWLGLTVGRQSDRLISLIFASVSLFAIAGSATGIYPLGGGRTDCYLIPLVTLLALSAAKRLLQWTHRENGLAAAGACILLLLLATAGPVAPYPEGFDADLVARLEREAASTDCVIIHPTANWVAGYYAGWPAHLERSSQWAQGFVVAWERPRTLAAPRAVDAPQRATVERFLQAEDCERVILFSKGLSKRPQSFTQKADRAIRQAILDAGYSERISAAAQGSALVTFELQAE